MADRLGTRGQHALKVPEYIKERKPFTTSGALKAKTYGERGCYDGSGELDIVEREAFFAESPDIDYVVWSYITPIAWHTKGKGWHIVNQRFSKTTSKHQGKLYLIEASA